MGSCESHHLQTATRADTQLAPACCCRPDLMGTPKHLTLRGRSLQLPRYWALWEKNPCVLLYVVFPLPSGKEQPVFFTLTVNPGSPMGPGNPDGPGIPWSPRSPFSPVGPSRPYGSRKICGFFARLIQADMRNIIARAKTGSCHPKNTLETPDNHQMPRETQGFTSIETECANT